SNQWRVVAPINSPPGRFGATLVSDAARNRLIVFGGVDSIGAYRSDTWAFDLAQETWTQLPDLLAAGRLGALAGVDASDQHTVVVGGVGASGPLSDVRVYDLAADAWSLATDAGTLSPPRYYAAGFVDPSANRLVVFGGAQEGATPYVSLLTGVAGDSVLAL